MTVSTAHAALGSEELIERARSLRPLLERTADESEALRTLCPEAVEALHEASLFGIWCPPGVGGHDADLVTQVDVMMELARADMSACWTLMIGASVTAMLATSLSDEAVNDIFSGGRLPTAAGSLRPAGRATPAADGGYRITGAWGFGSGIHHASWISANCLAEGNVPVAAAIPIEQVEIIDDWYVSGLCGSGSSSYSVEDVYVPAQHIMGPQPPRGRGCNASMVPRLPLEHACVSLGGVRHALDELARQAIDKHRLVDKASVASKQAFQLELGRLDAEGWCLRAGVRDHAQQLCDALESTHPDAGHIAVATRAVCAWTTQQCQQLGNRALRHAGAAAVLQTNVLQRIQRDLTVSAQHVMISDAAYEDYGRQLLGL